MNKIISQLKYEKQFRGENYYETMDRMLFINPQNSFPHEAIPMGIFGMCDYLSLYGIETRIFHAGLYNDYKKKLFKCIEEFKPKAISIPFHWKETLLSFVQISKLIKVNYPNISIITGGISAGYFCDELMNSLPQVDFLIKGDGEVPLRDLLLGYIPGNICNLFYRHGHSIKRPKYYYKFNPEIFKSYSFTKLDYLFDFEKYLELNKYRQCGLPFFIGRGCHYNCLFCGGCQ